MKHKTYLISGICISALAFCAVLSGQIMPRKSTSPSPTASPAAKEASSPAKSERAIPLRRGMISAVDEKAKTFTIKGKESSRVFKVTDKTVITKNGAPATFKDLAANEEVTGSYWKAADGTLEAKTVKLGPKSDTEKPAKKKSKKGAEGEASPAASPTP